ncbi:cytochrome P450 [Streptomyces sp. NPDC059922]|uniref:cytochrome P450 n=1 Tax=Streptomyces sp. NPDC059922 TaxID=3347005 RepID=UPI00364F8FDB
MTITLRQAGLALTDPAAYTDEPSLYEALALLRHKDPVHWCAAPGYRPFWAITRHADIREIEHRHDVFLNSPRAMLMSSARDRTTQWTRRLLGLNMLVQMDGPRHLAFRKISADWFRPKMMHQLEADIASLARHHIDALIGPGEDIGFTGFRGFTGDFAQHPAARFPLAVLLSMLGLPQGDSPRLLSLTQQLLGTDDPEQQRNAGPFAQPAVLFDLFTYFRKIARDRRAHPTDDLASVIANARIDGRPLSWGDTLSYYAVISTGGHDTTSAGIAGGLLALARHPEQLRLLRSRPDLLPHAAQEMIRITAPFKGFMRTAARDYELHGTTIRQGDAVFLSYVSANHDEAVFDEPETFDATRNPNPHLSFGHGVHACLGARLAHMEICAFYAELLPRIRTIEVIGAPRLIATTFTGGFKSLPVRLTRNDPVGPLSGEEHR